MDKESSVVKTIEKVFNNKEFLLEIINQKNNYSDEHFYKVLATVLQYYLATLDQSTNLSPREIENRFDELNRCVMTDKQFKDIVENGYLTHSFNGIEQRYIEEYGFDYFDKIPKEEQKKLLYIRKGLQRLESEIGKNHFQTYREELNNIEIVQKEVFLSVPGTKTIHYCTTAPERFYLGPVGYDSFSYFPVVVGESKKDYLKRILKVRIENMTRGVDEEELMDVAQKVVDYYTEKTSSIAFVKTSDLLDKKVYSTYYGNGDGDNLKNYQERLKTGRYYVTHCFTNNQRDIYEEPYDMGNFVVLSDDIKIDSISFSTFPDMYDLKQTYLIETGIDEGTLVDYYSCKKVDKSKDIEIGVKKYYKGL